MKASMIIIIFEIDEDNDYNKYFKFFTKNQKILSSSRRNTDIKYKDNTINNLQNIPNIEYQQCDKKNVNYIYNSNQNNIHQENYFNNCTCKMRIKKSYKNIKKDNNYNINIIDDNNFRDNKKYNNFNINLTEIENIPKIKINDNNFIIEKKCKYRNR